METGKAIYKLLKDSADVGAICADRIYPELAQQDVDVPFIVYTVTDTTPSGTKNATSKLDTARVELYCVSDDYEQSMDLGIACRTALDRQSGTVSGVEVQSIDFDTSDVQFDPDQRVYVLEQTYDVRVQRTGTAQVVSQFPGNTFTVEEVDGDPSGAVNKLVFSNGTVTIDGNTATVVSGGGAAGDSYHGRYDTQAEAERAGATGNVEYYYTARPDGDGEAESETSDTGETDTINRTLAYSTKFRADPDTAADWTDYTTQPADNASFATAKAALLNGLNETDATAETRGTLPLSLKMTRTTTAVSPDLLLDTYTGAAAAYSVRKLDKDYTGSCMRIRRSSDEATQDIGFDSNGDVDQSSIQSFCTGADCYVSIWYDQSGNSNHASQTVANDQPKIYDRLAGAVTTKNGKPILTFVDGSDHLDTSTVSLSGPHTAFACAYNQNSFSAQVSLMYHSSGNYLWIYAQNKVQIQSGSEFVSASGSYGDNSAIISCVIDGSNSISRGKNSVEEQTNTGTVTSRTITSIRLGAVTSGRETDVQEWILWNGAKDSTDRAAIETNINDYFSIY